MPPLLIYAGRTPTYVLEESGPCFLGCISPPFENSRLHQLDELASEVDGIVAREIGCFLNAAGEVLHKAAAEAQPVSVDLLKLPLTAIALDHEQPHLPPYTDSRTPGPPPKTLCPHQ
jgi:hypothetical protein